MESRLRLAAAIVAPLILAVSASAEETPKRGGTLTFMIPADAPPSFDGHREATFATVHAVAPFYSVLVRVNPQNPASTTDFVCDVCTEIPAPADGGRTYPFTIREDVKFEDGTRLTAYDVAASWNTIVAPAEGIISPRRGYYSMIDKVEAADPKTVVFRLRYATAAFIPAIADPYAFIYQKKVLDQDPHWHEKNIRGSGPFRFKEYQVGQSISGVRNPDYYHKGLPYLDGFTGIFADKQATRVSAIRGDRPAIEKSRAEARRLLKEAGQENLSFELLNRNVDQPYKFNGLWVIDEWSKIGVKVSQRVLQTGPFTEAVRSGEFEAFVDGDCQNIVNPLLDGTKYLPGSVSSNNYGNYEDPEAVAIYERMVRETDFAKQRALMRQFEKRVLDTEAHELFLLWRYRIVPHRSYVKGWKIGPSHYVNQDLATIWLDK